MVIRRSTRLGTEYVLHILKLVEIGSTVTAISAPAVHDLNIIDTWSLESATIKHVLMADMGVLDP